jgi:DNA-binding transcriptional MerR regulator
MRLKKTYSSREVAALTGLSARQLQLWAASGLLSPAIPSHRTPAGGYTERRYTPIEFFELLVLADLRRRGFSVHQLHLIIDVLKDRFRTRRWLGAPADRRPRNLREDCRGRVLQPVESAVAAAFDDRR